MSFSLFRSILLITLTLCVCNSIQGQKLSNSFSKAHQSIEKGDTTKALSTINKIKSTGNPYNKLLAHLYEIKWSPNTSQTLIIDLTKTELFNQVEKAFPKDSVLGFYFATLAWANTSHFIDHKGALQQYQNAIPRYEKSFGKQSNSIANKYLKLAAYAKKARNNQIVVDNYLKALGIKEKQGIELNEPIENIYDNIALAYFNLQKDNEVLIYASKAAEIHKKKGAYDRLMIILYRHGRSLIYLNRLKEATDKFLEVDSLLGIHPGPEKFSIEWNYYYLSNTYNRIYRYEDGAKYAKVGISKLRNYDVGYKLDFFLNYEAGFALTRLNNYEEALKYGKRATELDLVLQKDKCKLKTTYIEYGVFLRNAKFVRESLQQFEKAAEITEGCKLSDYDRAEQYQKLGVEYWNLLRDGKKALEYWELAHKIYDTFQPKVFKHRGTRFQDLTVAYRQQGRFDEAINAASEGREIFKELGEKEDYHKINIEYAMAYFDSGDLEKAYQILNEGVQDAEFGTLDSKTQGLYNIHLGEYFQETRDLDNALNYYFRALKFFDAEGKAKTYSMIAGIHFHEQRDDSVLYYYDLYEKTLKNNFLFSADKQIFLNTNRGRLFENREKFAKASELYESAIDLYKKNEGANKEWGINAFAGLINCYTHLEEEEKLEALSLDLEPLLGELLKEKNRNYISVFNKLGGVYYQRDKKKSLDYFQKAFFHNSINFKNYTSLESPEASDFIDHRKFLVTAKRKAATLVSIAIEADSVYKQYGNLAQLKAYVENYGNENPKNNIFYERALDTYMLCDTIINYTRELYHTEEAKQQLSVDANEIFELAIFNAYNFYGRTLDRRYKEMAYTFMSLNKARTLLESIKNTGAKDYRGIPKKLVKREKELEEKIVQLGIQYGQSKEARVRERYDKARADLALLNREIKSTYPEYNALKGSDNIATVPEIQAKLDDETAYVEYYLMPETGIIISTITNDTFDIEFTGSQFNAEKVGKGFRNSMLSKLDDYTDRFGRELYNELIEPINPFIQNKEKLVIVPDNLLGYLPFEALVDNKGKYLIENKEISYSYAGSLFLANKPGHEKIKSILAFAPVFEDEETNLLVATKERAIMDFNEKIDKTRNFARGGVISSLPGTETEVEKIHALYKEKGNLADYFLHKDANESRIKKMDLKKYKYLHFATHGIVDEDNPQLSGLIMSQDAKSEEDCILYSGEVFGLDLDAELVTLSACETGLGKVVRGEGIIGLSRAFLFAGAENVQVSLWKVSDASTSELMVKFYNGLIEGKSNRESLRAAKLHILNKPEYKQPYFWAPFILIGQ